MVSLRSITDTVSLMSSQCALWRKIGNFLCRVGLLLFTASIKSHFENVETSSVQGWQVFANGGLNFGLIWFKPSWQKQVSARVVDKKGKNEKNS